MLPVKYQIYELSARSVLGYAREQDGEYSFTLDAAETKNACPLPWSRMTTRFSIRSCVSCMGTILSYRKITG